MSYSSWIRYSLESSLLRTIHKHLFVQAVSYRWGIKWFENLWVSEGLQVTDGLTVYWRKPKTINHSAIRREEGRWYLFMSKSYLFGLLCGFVLVWFVFLIAYWQIQEVKDLLIAFGVLFKYVLTETRAVQLKIL